MPNAKKPRRNSKIRTAIIITVVLIALLVGGFFVADYLARGTAETTAQVALAREGFKDPKVKITSKPILPELVKGQVKHLDFSAESAKIPVGDLEVNLHALSGHAEDIKISSPGKIGSIEVTGTLSKAEIVRLVNAKQPKLNMSLVDGRFVSTQKILGVDVQIYVAVKTKNTPSGCTVMLQFQELGVNYSWLGGQFDISKYIPEVAFTFSDLGQGFKATNISEGADGITLTAVGHDIPLQ